MRKRNWQPAHEASTVGIWLKINKKKCKLLTDVGTLSTGLDYIGDGAVITTEKAYWMNHCQIFCFQPVPCWKPPHLYVKWLLLCLLSTTTLFLYPFICGFLRCCRRFIPVPHTNVLTLAAFSSTNMLFKTHKQTAGQWPISRMSRLVSGTC